MTETALRLPARINAAGLIFPAAVFLSARSVQTRTALTTTTQRTMMATAMGVIACRVWLDGCVKSIEGS